MANARAAEDVSRTLYRPRRFVRLAEVRRPRASGGGDRAHEQVSDDCRFGSPSDGAILGISGSSAPSRIRVTRASGVRHRRVLDRGPSRQQGTAETRKTRLLHLTNFDRGSQSVGIYYGDQRPGESLVAEMLVRLPMCSPMSAAQYLSALSIWLPAGRRLRGDGEALGQGPDDDLKVRELSVT